MKRLCAFLLAVALGALVAPAWAHPGRLDQQGCHVVRKSGGFTYKSGRLAPEGQYHCHRGLVGKPIILDGLEVLGERGDQDREEDGGEVDREPSAQSQDRQEHAPAEGWLRLY